MMRVFPFLLIALVLGACWYPPFEEDATLAVMTAEKLDPVYVIQAKGWPTDYRFFPLPLSRPGGFLMGETPESVSVLYAERGYLSFDAVEIDGGLPVLPGFNPYEAAVFGDFATAPQFVAIFPGARIGDPWEDDVVLFSYDAGLKALDPNPTGLSFISDVAYPGYFSVSEPGVPEADLSLVGLSVSPSSDPTKAVLSSLIRRNSDESFYELEFSLAAGGAASFVKNIVSTRNDGLRTALSSEGWSSPLPDKLRYYTSEAGARSYANYPKGSSYETLSWDADGVVGVIGISEKIGAVLSSGDILTEKDGYGRIYGPGGNLRFKFPLGDLRFVYEVYRDGVPTLLFSAYSSGKYLDPQYAIYSLATSKIANLE